MSSVETKAIKNLQQKIQDVSEGTIRRQVLENAKNFKSSWIGLGQALYTVWKDKLYKDWGYSEFDTYTKKEIGIHKQTALKLLKSYYFLEKKEPAYLKRSSTEETDAASVPSYESVDALRLANNKRGLDKLDYEQIKKSVLEKGKDAREVKKDLTALIKQREELLPQEAWQKKRLTMVRRFLSTLKSVRQEMKMSKMLSAQIGKEIDKLIAKLETEIS